MSDSDGMDWEQKYYEERAKRIELEVKLTQFYILIVCLVEFGELLLSRFSATRTRELEEPEEPGEPELPSEFSRARLNGSSGTLTTFNSNTSNSSNALVSNNRAIILSSVPRPLFTISTPVNPDLNELSLILSIPRDEPITFTSNTSDTSNTSNNATVADSHLAVWERELEEIMRPPIITFTSNTSNTPNYASTTTNRELARSQERARRIFSNPNHSREESMLVKISDEKKIFESPTCVICMDNDPVAELRCGHKCCCLECFDRIMMSKPVCPLCRVPIVEGVADSDVGVDNATWRRIAFYRARRRGMFESPIAVVYPPPTFEYDGLSELGPVEPDPPPSTNE